MKVKINFYELRKINLLKSLTMIVLSTGLLMSTSCEELDELLGLEDDEEVTDYSGSSGGSTNAAYYPIQNSQSVRLFRGLCM